MNTYSDSTGRFRLVSNDICTHFEVSAPGCSKVKFDKKLPYPAGLPLPDRTREYQQIPLLGWGPCIPVPPDPSGKNVKEEESFCETLPWAAIDDSAARTRFDAPRAVEASMGKIVLERY
jgi:hypothetical protein